MRRAPQDEDLQVKSATHAKDLATLLDAAAAQYAQGRLEEAARLYRRAEAADPRDVRAAYSLAVIDIRGGRAQRARRRLRTVVALDPNLLAARQNLGAVCEDLGLWAEAASAYEQALALCPDAGETRFSLARLFAVLGRLDDAKDAYRTLIADPASRPRALIRLAVLAPEALGDDDLAELRRLSADPALDAETRTGLWFALGGTLDRRGADDEAFAAFAAGNRLKHEVLAAAGGRGHPDAAARAHQAAVQQVEGLFTAQFLAGHQGRGDASAAPIFIVGMPRSGSSLIEQILASHRQVQGMGESAALSDLVDRDFKGASAAQGDWRRLAEAYLGAMRERGWRGGGRLVDKTLENHLRVGLIHLMFPKAVILHSVRDPVDVCLACWRQLFASGNETLYDLRQIGEAYVLYRRMMRHWDEVLPGRVIEVNHEALVADPQGRIRWLVTEACGLDWDPACLNFHETQGPVRTASAAQVRRPVFQTSVGRWRRYEGKLALLLEALGEYSGGDDA
jgi:tetratricopeptide (TPR) repeat protein